MANAKKRKPSFLFWDKSYSNAFKGGEEPKEAFSEIEEHFQLYFDKAWGVRIIAVSNKCQNTVSKTSLPYVYWKTRFKVALLFLSK